MREKTETYSRLSHTAVAAAAALLFVYTAACASRTEEQWNSYYYGQSLEYERGILYYGNEDNDVHYERPREIGNGCYLQDATLLHGEKLR